MTARLRSRFAALKADNRAGFLAYVMAGDPDLATSWELLDQLPAAGADVIELGFPFSDPTADGPSIQRAGQRALKAGTRLDDVLALARRFRAAHPDTPLILMGYANPVHRRGWTGFAGAAAEAGVDGIIVVDLPPEEDGALNAGLADRDIALVRLATPTADAARIDVILENARGFLYYVSVTGVTGTVSAATDAVERGLEPVRRKSGLPVAVGFGVRAPEQAAAIARCADAVVVGSAIVDALAEGGPAAALSVTRSLA
ncbi:MAG: tryptophan synthase subunit alpha, partial [Caulobacterales bacterium]|nr:tryptophan synthase subunit alpha [Caulobacterales bacterium]